MIDMALTPEQLAKRRSGLRERINKKLKRRESNAVPPENKWKRRGIKCDRYEGLHEKINRMLQVETSALVPNAVLDMRMSKCIPCVHVSEKMDGTLFCECCGCASWTFKIADKLMKAVGKTELALGSDLQSKNRHAQHRCLAKIPQFDIYEEGKNDGNS